MKEIILAITLLTITILWAITNNTYEKEINLKYEKYYKQLCDEIIPDSTYCKIRENNLEITYEEIWDKYRALSK